MVGEIPCAPMMGRGRDDQWVRGSGRAGVALGVFLLSQALPWQSSLSFVVGSTGERGQLAHRTRRTQTVPVRKCVFSDGVRRAGVFPSVLVCSALAAYSRCGLFARQSRARVALSAKKRVDPAVLAKRAEAAKKREEALKKAAENRARALSETAADAASADEAAATVEPTASAVTTAKSSAPPAAPPTDRRPPVPKAKAKAKVKPESSPVVVTSRGRGSSGSSSSSGSGGSALTEEQIKKMKVVELKDALRDAGLKVSGRKAELLERLLQHIGVAELA